MADIAQYDLVNPVDFVTPGSRLFIDTNVFMDTNPQRKGGIKRLFERCGEPIRRNANPLVVVGKVVKELTIQSHDHTLGLTEDRAEAVRRAGRALQLLEDAESQKLVRTDIGHDSNPYADDLFAQIFKLYAGRYSMCLLTNDITLCLRIRLMAKSAGRRLIAGSLTGDGLIEVEPSQTLYERGVSKLQRKRAEGDQREADVLEPLLKEFQHIFGLTATKARYEGTLPLSPIRPMSAPNRARIAFIAGAKFKGPDRVLAIAVLPGEGDTVHFESPAANGSLILGEKLGDGREGTAFAVEGDRVVKVFFEGHVTEHRKQKLSLLTTKAIKLDGICFPEAMVTNRNGEFVGYVMPRANGQELKQTICNPRRFKKAFPDWTKTDLVDVCISFLEKVAYLHSLNIIVGDINPKNLMVDANKNVWIIDADSWQFNGYPCPVGFPQFTASSAAGKPYSETLRTAEEELFAVATMLFMVLITGQFPYARTGTDGADFVRLIKEGNFAFQYKEHSNQDQPEGNWKYMWSHLHPDIKKMFWHTFHRDGDFYTKRPTANEWLAAFREYRRWLRSGKNFDPMSNDVYPFRYKAFRPDTPISDCILCKRKHAVVGEWNDLARTYSTPALCFDCSQLSLPKCLDCGTPKTEGSLRNGRCRECNRMRDYASCAGCGNDILQKYLVAGLCTNCQLGTCKRCRKSVRNGELTYGRCSACDTRAKELDRSRRCVDCNEPFITFDHVDWFKGKGLDVAKSHSALKQGCPLPALATTPSPRHGSSTAPRIPPPEGFWVRLKKWFQGN